MTNPQAEQFKATGNTALQSGNLTQAIESYTQAINLDGTNHVYFSNRSAAYLKKGDANNALEDATSTIALNPDFSKGYSRKGAALHSLKRYDDAMAAFQEGLEKFPGNAALTKGLQDVKRDQEGPPPRTTGGMMGGGIPSGASCWICFEEGPDEEGQPLVRDCSCRGESGFCHFSCIVKYAERKSEECNPLDNVIDDYSKPWHQCPNCNQDYQNALLLNLADAFMSFTKKLHPCHPAIECFGFPCNPVLYLEALDTKASAYRHMANEYNSKKGNNLDENYYHEQQKKVASEILSLVEQLKTHCEIVYGRSSVPDCVISYEAGAFNTLGSCMIGEAVHNASIHGRDVNMFRSGIEYLEKSRDLARSIRDTTHANSVEIQIAQAKVYAGHGSNMKHTIKYLREQYNKDPDCGMPLFDALLSKHHTIECERLLAEMIARSRRINGPNHNETIRLENSLDFRKARKATVFYPGIEGVYDVLRYLDDGDKYVLHGPWAKINCPREEARNVKPEEVKTIAVEADKVKILPGTPVICHGLKNASHLNCKIGDMRAYAHGKGEEVRCNVHFEDESLKPCLIKPENLRILFDLPAKA